MLYFRACIIYSEVCGICSYDALMGWTYAFPNPREPEILHGSYLSGIAPGKNFQQLMSFSKYERWMKGYALNKWESTLNPVFMPMDTMYTLSWKLLLK